MRCEREGGIGSDVLVLSDGSLRSCSGSVVGKAEKG